MLIIIKITFSYLEVNYSHENFQYLDLGQEFDLGEKSFTLASLVRLRPDENLHANYTNRGARNAPNHEINFKIRILLSVNGQEEIKVGRKSKFISIVHDFRCL